MNNPHDDDLDARLKEIRRRQAAYSAAHPGRYYLLSDEDMDDIASDAMLRMFEARRQRRAQQASPPPTKPNN